MKPGCVVCVSSSCQSPTSPRSRTARAPHYRGPAFVAIGDQVEEQLAAEAIKGHEAELIDNQNIDVQEALLQAVSPRLSRASSSCRTRSAARVKSTRRFCRRLDAERDRQVRLCRCRSARRRSDSRAR